MLTTIVTSVLFLAIALLVVSLAAGSVRRIARLRRAQHLRDLKVKNAQAALAMGTAVLPVPVSDLVCAHCHAPLLMGAKFCTQCDTEVTLETESALICPSCAEVNPDDAQYCFACGTQVQPTKRWLDKRGPRGATPPGFWDYYPNGTPRGYQPRGPALDPTKVFPPGMTASGVCPPPNGHVIGSTPDQPWVFRAKRPKDIPPLGPDVTR